VGLVSVSIVCDPLRPLRVGMLHTAGVDAGRRRTEAVLLSDGILLAPIISAAAVSGNRPVDAVRT